MPEAVVTFTQNQIAALWLRNQTQTLDRLDLLERAAAASHSLPPDLRAEAIAVAHKFAGSLGMFGFHDGTHLAREIELHFESPTPDPTTLHLLIAQLRAAISPRG